MTAAMTVATTGDVMTADAPVPAGPAPEHPVAAVLEGAAGATGRVEVVPGEGTGPGWVPLADVVRADGYRFALDLAAAYYGGAGAPARAAAATLFSGDVAGALAATIAGPWARSRRVFRPEPGEIALRFGLGVEAVAVGRPAVAVLPGDPLAGRPGVTVLDDAGLRAAAAGDYAALVGPLVEVTCAAVSRGRRAMWAEAAERLAAAVRTVTSAGRPHDADDAEAGDRDRDESLALLAAGPPSLHVPPGPAGASGPCRRVCCLAYRTDLYAGQLCGDCPRAL